MKKSSKVELPTALTVTLVLAGGGVTGSAEEDEADGG